MEQILVVVIGLSAFAPSEPVDITPTAYVVGDTQTNKDHKDNTRLVDCAEIESADEREYHQCDTEEKKQ